MVSGLDSSGFICLGSDLSRVVDSFDRVLK